MPFATSHTIALSGAVGHLIDVQADVSSGQVATVLVGRPDAALNEARDRCRMAIVNSRLEWPSSRRTTILLSPADLPKRGTHYDLAIAVAVLGAVGLVPPESLCGAVFIGELTLSGGLRSVPGVLPMVLAAADRGYRHVFVPQPQVREAAMVPGMEVLGMRSLAQVVAELRDEPVPEAPPVAEMSGSRLLSWRGSHRMDEVDLADLAGMEDTRYAVEVAAAGGHHLLLSGPKGSGKTSIAERIPGILPDLTREESIELTAVHSLAGALQPGDGLLTRPPFTGPHHDASTASLVGGGSGTVRPGEISRAHCGVLFLDEFPLFRADVINALRQPLESGDITVARGEESVVLPARTLVVLAANPCPCGDFHPDARVSTCQCREVQRRDYRRKVNGPVTDRIDITRHLAAPSPTAARDPFAVRESTAAVRARVEAARARQADRYAGEQWRLNGHVPGPALAAAWPMTPDATRLVDDQLWNGRLTRRGVARVHRLAWTVADLAEVERPGVTEAEVALRLRSGTPLLASTLRRAG
jgi:magnesium chelatase family protein